MRVAISGSSGLIGSQLTAALEAEGHSITPIICSGRKAPPGAVSLDVEALKHEEEGLFTTSSTGWISPNPRRLDSLHCAELEGIDAVVHLAGENIVKGRWTRSRKSKILNSRLLTTMAACKALSQLQSPPVALLTASAVGVYGDRKDEQLDERSAPGFLDAPCPVCAPDVCGQDEEECGELVEESICDLEDEPRSSGAFFLAEVCERWETSRWAFPLLRTRTVSLRLGAVLSGKGGALMKMLPPFRWGLGGVIGSGEQYMSWIAIDDVVGAIKHVLATQTLQGPVNIVSPNPVTNREFTKTLGKVLRRPTLLPIPAFAVRLAFGELADALLLSSQRAIPRKLLESGYVFKYPVLEDALRHVLGVE